MPYPTGTAIDCYAINANLYQRENGGAGNGSIALSQLNAPASTVELCEVQNAPQIILPPDGKTFNSSAGDGGFNYTAGGGSPTSYYGVGLYATGPIGNSASPPTPGGFPNLISSGTGVHSDGSNYFACDGHVKWLRGSSISGGNMPANSMSQGYAVPNSGSYAAGTANLTTLGAGGVSPVVLTFSPT